MLRSTAPTAASWSRSAFTPAGFKAPLGLKDMRLVGEAADKSRVAMPLLSLVRDHLLETIAKEGEDIDWSGIGKTVARNTGIAEEKHAQLWINHDKSSSDARRHAPEFYD